MAHLPLLDELAIIAAIGVFVAVVLARLRLPTVAGLLFAGALIGPSGFRLVSSIESIEVLAEMGVILLLFTIGLEFSLSRLRHIGKQVAVGGSIQVGLTLGATLIVATLAGQPFRRAVLYGFIVSLSSTAVVLRALNERRELDAPHGRFIVGALIFQDLCVVPMVLIVPLLARSDVGPSDAVVQILLALGKAAAVVAGIALVSKLIVPRIFQWVDESRSREVFLLSVLGVCLGTAWLTSLAGLSFALGAFLGGMVVADTEYGHRAMGDMLPLRDAFTSVFFISLGMMFDLGVVMRHSLEVLALVAAFLLGKGLLATLAAMAMRFPSRVAWLAGVGLAQFGEFGFVLARLGAEHSLVDADDLKSLISAGIISMFLTPVLVRIAPHITAGERLLRPLEKLIGARSIDEPEASPEKRTGHIILVGYGVAGRVVSQALEQMQTPYLVIELNAETVRAASDKGVPIYYGDATSQEALEHAGLRDALALVLVMNDSPAAKRVVDTARRIAPETPILMRTRFLAERQGLLDLGASDVIAEEVEAAVEILARVLRQLEVPRNLIESHIQEARSSTQQSQRAVVVPRNQLQHVERLGELKIESVLLEDHSYAVGRTIAELDLRARTHALIVALERDGKLLDHPNPHERLRAHDLVYFVGSATATMHATSVLLFGSERETFLGVERTTEV